MHEPKFIDHFQDCQNTVTYLVKIRV